MLTAYLAGSGGRVEIPDAVGIEQGDSYEEVRFVDAAGKALVIFRRADLSLYFHDGQNVPTTGVARSADGADEHQLE